MPCSLLIAGVIATWPNLATGIEQSAVPARAHEITGGIASSFFQGHRDSTSTAWMIDVAYHYRPQQPTFLQSMRFTGGLRFGVKPDDAGAVVDMYVRGAMVANVGAWTPTLGPEIGFSTLGTRFFRYSVPFPDDSTTLSERKLSPFYVGLVVVPLRFCFSRVTLSVLELSIGAPMVGIGSVSRFQLGLVNIGGTL